MAKKKVTECQKLINEVDQEDRKRLEDRFKAAYKTKLVELECLKESLENAKIAYELAETTHAAKEYALSKMEIADLDKWGKENPEPKEPSFIIAHGGRGAGRNSFYANEIVKRAMLEYNPLFNTNPYGED